VLAVHESGAGALAELLDGVGADAGGAHLGSFDGSVCWIGGVCRVA
jgi:hypothetical protein